ncbi:MAG: primosomal protein N', partial [Actinomycetota bacterium]
MSPEPDAAAPRDTCLVEVALPVPLPETFTYRWEGTAPEDRPGPGEGDLVAVPFGRRRQVIGLVVAVRPAPAGVVEVRGHRLRSVTKLLPEAYRLGPQRLALARWVAAYHALTLGEVVPLFHPPAPGTRVRKVERARESYPLSDSTGVRLTPSQRDCVQRATGHLARSTFGAILVHGVTGSGKTEIFLRVMAEALARDRGAIYLLPEIALTPQTLARITERFGSRAAAIHSGLSAGERCRVHEEAAAGRIRIVVGPRSALFVPVRDLGAIIVDEEHETSYKQEEKPRYHARNVALVRARTEGAVILLGSATPDLESYHNARGGRFHLVTLTERAVGQLPEVEIVDMRGPSAPDGFSPRLVDRIEQTLAAGHQVILFYNRRGFARVIQCQAC